MKQRVSFIIQDITIEDREWRRGYWQQPIWRQPPVAPGQMNEIIRKYRTLMGRSRGQFPQSKELQFEDLCARDEERLAKAIDRSKRKRKAVKEAADAEVEI